MNFDLKKIIKKKTVFDYVMYGLIIVVGIFLDQLTKFLSAKFLTLVDTIPLIKFGNTQVLNLTYNENTGAAFGMLKDHRWVFLSISTIAIIAMLAYLFLGHANTKLEAIGISMLISGGIGNMIDRLALGYVIDFIDFRLINFAIFNGADSFVCVGAGILMLALVLEIVKESKTQKSEEQEQ